MKLKNGRELSILEIIKRLNIMGIEYNSDIIGKKYYIELYDKAIKSPSNLEKIKNDINKDKMYMDFYNQKLKKKTECSFIIGNENNLLYNNIPNNNNKYILTDNIKCRKKNFFNDFNGGLMNKIVTGHLCFTAYDYAVNNKNKFENIINKIMIPINELKKSKLINIYPDIKKEIFEIMNKFEKLNIDKFSIIAFLILIILTYILIRLVLKKNKK